MANPGFGGGDFDALARQYWSTWGDAMRNVAAAGQPSAPQPTVPGWNEAAAWWSQLARGGHSGADDAVQRFNTQAQGWFGQMQQLAAQFAGRDASAGDVADQWRKMLGGAGGNPFAQILGGMSGPGQHGPERWLQQAAPYLEMLQRQSGQWLDAPAFGFAREHQERLQQLAKAQAGYQQRSQAYQSLMAEAGQSAFGHFERKLSERGEPGRQLDSGRALFDLWIDAAEEAYAEIALSPRFREVYGEYVNAQMRLRGAVQGEVEQVCTTLGMPTRTEIDATHRKIVQLEREVRRLRDVAQDRAPTASHNSSKDARDDGRRKPTAPPRERATRAAAKPAPRAAARSAAWQADAPKAPSRAASTRKPARGASASRSGTPSKAAVRQASPGRKAVLGDQAPARSAARKPAKKAAPAAASSTHKTSTRKTPAPKTAAHKTSTRKTVNRKR